MYNFNGDILYENIKTMCELKNTTITALEREVGLSVPSISKWKDGNPTIQKILLVANALGVSIEYLLTSNIHETRNLTEMFLESVYVKTDTRQLAWEKNNTNALIQIKSRPYIRENLLYMADTSYDDDLIVYSTKIGEKELYCSHFIIVNDFMDEELHTYHESWHVDIRHEDILEELDDGALAQKIFDKLTDISYYEPRRNSLNQFMTDFISAK
ncbi:MAG: helix-turn-helix transcriptional regulator [Lachnospiraceae bacterium]|nr:helix-turn-helix transcriptional regulator [Lachnospiraceae bacterium]